IQHLDLHAHVGSVTLEGRADANAIVSIGAQLEFKSQNEIRVVAFGEEISATSRRTHNNTVARNVAFALFSNGTPAIQRWAVKDAGKARFSFCRQPTGPNLNSETGRQEQEKLCFSHRL